MTSEKSRSIKADYHDGKAKLAQHTSLVLSIDLSTVGTLMVHGTRRPLQRGQRFLALWFQIFSILPFFHRLSETSRPLLIYRSYWRNNLNSQNLNPKLRSQHGTSQPQLPDPQRASRTISDL